MDEDSSRSSGMRYHLSLVIYLQQSCRHRFCAGAVLLRANANPVQLPGTRLQLAQERGVALLPEVSG